MKRQLVLLVLVASLLAGCEGNISQRSNNETIQVQTCGRAERVGSGSCNANVWKFGGGN